MAKISTGMAGATQAVAQYACGPSELYLGKEIGFTYQGVFSRPVSVSLVNVTNPAAHLFILKQTANGCDPDSCAADASPGTSATFAAAKGQTYFFVIDVPEANGETTFDMAVSCGNGEDCANGLDDNGNNLVDCADTGSCSDDPACKP